MACGHYSLTPEPWHQPRDMVLAAQTQCTTAGVHLSLVVPATPAAPLQSTAVPE